MSMSFTPKKPGYGDLHQPLGVLIEQKLGFQLTFPTQESVEAERKSRGSGRYPEIQRAAKILALPLVAKVMSTSLVICS
jgi:hypothetical protein